MARFKVSRDQLAKGIVIAIGIAVAASVIWAFTQKLMLSHTMRVEERGLEREVAVAETRQADLEGQLEYVQTDEYVERWARVEARMVKPGEVAVVPITVTPEPTPAEAVIEGTPAPAAESFWLRVNCLFPLLLYNGV